MAEGAKCRAHSHLQLYLPLHGVKGSLRRAACGSPPLTPFRGCWRSPAVGQFFVSTGGSVLMSVEGVRSRRHFGKRAANPSYIDRVEIEPDRV